MGEGERRNSGEDSTKRYPGTRLDAQSRSSCATPSLTVFSLFHHLLRPPPAHCSKCAPTQATQRPDTFTTPQISPRIQCALFYISITEVSQLRVRAPAPPHRQLPPGFQSRTSPDVAFTAGMCTCPLP